MYFPTDIPEYIEPTSYTKGNQSETGYQLTQFEVHPKGSHKGHPVDGWCAGGCDWLWSNFVAKMLGSWYGRRRKERTLLSVWKEKRSFFGRKWTGILQCACTQGFGSSRELTSVCVCSVSAFRNFRCSQSGNHPISDDIYGSTFSFSFLKTRKCQLFQWKKLVIFPIKKI